MSVGGLTKLYHENQEVLDIVMGMDLKRVLDKKYRIQRTDFKPGERASLLNRCAQRIKRQTNYASMVDTVKDDPVEASKVDPVRNIQFREPV